MNSTDKQPYCEKCHVVHDIHIELYCKKISELLTYNDCLKQDLDKVRKEAVRFMGERDRAQDLADSNYRLYDKTLNQLNAVREELEALPKPIDPQPLHSEMVDFIKSLNDANAAKVKPEPSRLEIAAMFMAGSLAGNDAALLYDEAVAMADGLIAASKEGK